MPRSKLLSRLRSASEGKATLIVAAAGSGKSVLLGQLWASEIDRIVCWCPLGPADRDPVRFAHHVVSFLAIRAPEAANRAREQLDAASERLGAEALSAVVEGLAELGELLILVDDVHELSPASMAELGDLVRTSPPNAHFVLASRTEPDEELLSWEGAITLARFGQSDLALTAGEVAQVVQKVAGVELDARQRSTLAQRTEGWAAGAQVVALALRDREDLGAVIDGFRGDDRTLARYLKEEVLGREPPEVREFLLRTSVVTELCASLADQLTGRDDSQAMLEAIEHRCLLLTRVAGEGEWFRYHQLFAEMLRSELKAIDAGEFRRQALVAARWHEANGDLFIAGELMVDAEAWDELLALVFEHGWELYEQGHMGATVRWAKVLPPGLVRSSQRVILILAAQARGLGNAATCDAMLSDLEAQGYADDYVKAGADTLRCLGVQYGEPLENVIKLAAEVRRWASSEPSSDHVLGTLESPAFLRMRADLAAGRAEGYLGNRDRALQLLGEVSKGHQFWAARVGALGSMAHVEARAGELVHATELAGEAMELANEHDLMVHGPCSDAVLALGMVARARGRLDRARDHLDDAIYRTEKARRIVLEVMCRAESLRVDAASDVEAGLVAAERFRTRLGSPLPARVEGQLAAAEVWLWLAAGRLDRAGRLLAASALTPDTLDAAAALAVTSGDPAKARSVLDVLPKPTTLWCHLVSDVWSAVAAQMEGDGDGALATMTSALDRAAPQGHVRVFLDAGPVALDLVKRCSGQGVAYADVVIGALTHPVGDLRLSERELTVLRSLATTDSNKAIAEKLYISTNTLKTHLRRIYRKMGVTNRREAVHKAVASGLISNRDSSFVPED